jgi:hypothetical protein
MGKHQHWDGEKRTPAPTKVEIEEGGSIYAKVEGTEKVEKAIHGEILKRFSRVGSAKVCRGAIFKLLGYRANTATAIYTLEGNFRPPKGTHPATVIILNKIAAI